MDNILSMTHHPRPWWYSLALRIVPGRCREIPEAQNPDRMVLRQVALVQNRRAWQLYAISKLVLFTDACPPTRWLRFRNRFWLAILWIVSFANVYLQQFASDEDPRFMHSHPYTFMVAIGLWGGYIEHRIAGAARRRRAPYLYAMDGGHVHHVQRVTTGHTSIFIGLCRQMDGTVGDKHYYGVPTTVSSLVGSTVRSLWSDHIKVQVKRI